MDTSGQQDTTRGGISTISRQPVRPAAGARARPQQVPVAAQPPNARSVPPEPAAKPPAPAAAGSHRMPFVLLLCGLLGGALVSALVISTTLAAGSFQITGLQQSTAALARQRQALQEQVAQAQSAPVIEKHALKLGMRMQGQLRFIDLKTGKTLTDQGTGFISAVNVPGFTP